MGSLPSGIYTFEDGTRAFVDSWPADMDPAARLGIMEMEWQEAEYRNREIEQALFDRELTYEAQRRGCSEDELLALWQDEATYIPDYDDHSSDDPRAEQNIICELGMSIFNPFITWELS